MIGFAAERLWTLRLARLAEASWGEKTLGGGLQAMPKCRFGGPLYDAGNPSPQRSRLQP